MADGLKENHTIFGIHFNGNEGFINNFGFLEPANDQTKADSAMLTRIGPDLQAGVRSLQSC